MPKKRVNLIRIVCIRWMKARTTISLGMEQLRTVGKWNDNEQQYAGSDTDWRRECGKELYTG